jgi:hypothetical protein
MLRLFFWDFGKMNEEDRQSLLAFVREAGTNVNKNGPEPLSVPIRQARHVLEEWAAGLIGASVPPKGRTPPAVGFVAKHLGASQQIEAYVEQLPATAVHITIATDAAATQATTTGIADEIEKLLRVQTEVDQVEDRSVAARPLVDQHETDNAPTPSQEKLAPIEGIAGQREPANMASVTEIGLLGAIDVRAENAEPKSSKNKEEISEFILEGLRQVEGFPECGVDLTVYGFGAYWNAMMTFAPGATTFGRASVYRKVLPLLVFELRKRFELA